jgi:glucosylceramidase
MCPDFPGLQAQLARPCSPKVYPGLTGGIVCVCNATYCDDIEDLGELSPDSAVIYSSSAAGKRMERTTATWQNLLAPG